MSAARGLDVHLYGQRIGVLRQDAHGNPGFRYDEAWRGRAGAVPLSLSMPLLLPHFGKRQVAPFLWGLLPENPKVLEALARGHQVSPRNPVALLALIGEDCAGAVQFRPPGAAVQDAAEGAVDWLTEADIGQRLAQLRGQSGGMGRKPGERGRFSLAGAQPKTALHLAGERWGIPSGRVPTTHILKPPMPGLEGQVENEHFCLSLARRLGFLVPRSAVRRFGDEPAIVVERYDRYPVETESGTLWQRIHQEDLCQALSVMPERKYQADGGPGVKAILRLLAAHSSAAVEDRHAFLRALAFNFLIAGTDAHAKNFSLLILPGDAAPEVRLAPLYDINSALPYDDDLRGVELSLGIDGRRGFDIIMLRHWQAEARASQMDADRVVTELRAMMAAIPDLASATLQECRAEGIGHPVLHRLVDRLAARCARLQRLYFAA
ncbi:type II toxin-antitoxin system HipA family toxin [Roseomonas sp. 18066]|uniref:type II toxin-antitoxin system HipA family toxin n=1 Tax=Roseomonas sp. 18066 TaxID=2681412 RepID=UPI00190F9510|nr:type II toxin-antitoxin system HipA family toxin [Roseomonas sp. 18066]